MTKLMTALAALCAADSLFAAMTCSAFAFVLGAWTAFAHEQPLMMIRLRGPHTANDAQWAKTFKALSENRAACDEVWFSTGIGFPNMKWHEAHVRRLVRYAEQLRGVGIVPSLSL